ncbi:hypothetical protein [Actinomadura oligospora]|uniref:hypothetical protein n=1 Tax=Actinomadura oligospora TaxID=111804 RepID=UPI0004B10BD0|nr:hypothetical protein [Actinomadura oligospora]
MASHTRFIAGSCLILAPVVQALSTFFWEGDRQGITTGTLIMLATLGWIVGLARVFHDIEERVPRYAAVAWPLAVYGCLGGASFGLQGLSEELFGVSHDQAVKLMGEHPAAAFLTLWVAGVLFPTSMIALGVVLTRIRYVPLPTGVLIVVGAVVFPLSRIPREVVIAHVADLILILPFAHLGFLMLTRRPSRTSRRSSEMQHA